jgi:hypothetical protein
LISVQEAADSQNTAQQKELEVDSLRAKRASAEEKANLYEADAEDATNRALEAEAEAKRLRNLGSFEQATVQAAAASQLHKKARDSERLAQSAGIQVEATSADMARLESECHEARAHAEGVQAEYQQLLNISKAACQVRFCRSCQFLCGLCLLLHSYIAIAQLHCNCSNTCAHESITLSASLTCQPFADVVFLAVAVGKPSCGGFGHMLWSSSDWLQSTFTERLSMSMCGNLQPGRRTENPPNYITN